MKYTYQIYVNGYSFPEGDEVKTANSQREIFWKLEAEQEEAQRFGAAYESEGMEGGVMARVWKGQVDDVTDVCPDFDMYIGPRGGMQIVPC